MRQPEDRPTQNLGKKTSGRSATSPVPSAACRTRCFSPIRTRTSSGTCTTTGSRSLRPLALAPARTFEVAPPAVGFPVFRAAATRVTLGDGRWGATVADETPITDWLVRVSVPAGAGLVLG